MRLIDADSFKDNLDIKAIWDDDYEMDKFVRYMDEEPTVDAVPVVHGRWILHEDGSATCTNCRRHTKNCWDQDSFYRHCPDCGAKMDLEVE